MTENELLPTRGDSHLCITLHGDGQSRLCELGCKWEFLRATLVAILSVVAAAG